MSNKLIVGLTGSFGSGKTTVSHLLEELGAFVVDADALAHETLMKGAPVFDQIAREFKDAVAADGESMDRKKLAAIIFGDEARRKKLEALIHPYVHERIWEEIAEADGAVVVLEVPLLFEAGFDKFCDKKIVVTASEAEVKKRLSERGFSAGDLKSRMRAQMPVEEKLKLADIVICNDASIETTRKEVEKVWKTLRSLSKGARS